MAWVRQTQAEVDELFAGLRARDPLGHALHLGLAVPACFLAAFPTTWLEWAWWPVFVCFLVRMISHHRIMGPLVWEWPARLAAMWVAWGALSLAWTAGTREAWLAEWGVARYALLVPALWPVMNERRWLIGALAAGVIVGNLSQVGHSVGQAAGIEWLVWPRFEDRNSGWWDPVVGGSVLCAALGLHVAGLLLGRSVRERVLGGVMCAITLAAIAATGTRGAWIAAALVGACGVVVAGWRMLRGGTVAGDGSVSGAGAKGIAIAAVLVVVCGAAVWFAAGETIAKRVRETREEVARAMDGDYSTFTGARLAMWGWAGRAFSAHPVIGVGEGGYKAWVEREIASGASTGGEGPVRAQVHAHAHSMVLHAAAVTGLVGVVLLGELVIVCVWNGLRGSHSTTEIATGTKWQASSGYDAGPALAMVGLACAGLFDSIQVNQQTAYWMWVLVALCLQRRPAAAVGPIWRKEQKEFAGVGSGGGVA